jgi:glycosyltransferase involved in cell wall biosynthesis
MSSDRPLISVILPVYNGQAYLFDALHSIMMQSLNDFELIIIDDGSTDSSSTIIQEYNDSRIRFFQQPNKGLAATLNRGISLAEGKYVARQDQDDISFPLRFQKQLEYLEANPEVAMVGTFAEIWEGSTRTSRKLVHPTDDDELKFGLLFNNHFVHSSMMIRRSIFDAVGGYSEDRSKQPPEDYELWSRVMRRYKVANLPVVLVAYREVPNSMSRTGNSPFLPNLIRLSAENIAWASGFAVDSPEVVALSKLSHGVNDGIPNGVSYSQLRSLIDVAIKRIAAEAVVSIEHLNKARRVRLTKLLYQYWNYQSGGLLGRAVNCHWGLHIKKLISKVFGMGNS